MEACCDYRDHGGTPCACECHGADWWGDEYARSPFRDDASHLLEGTVSYGMAIPDEDPSRDNEAFEGWGPGR